MTEPRAENEPTPRGMLADDMWGIGTATVSLTVHVAVVVGWSVRMVTHRYRPPETS